MPISFWSGSIGKVGNSNPVVLVLVLVVVLVIDPRCGRENLITITRTTTRTSRTKRGVRPRYSAVCSGARYSTSSSFKRCSSEYLWINFVSIPTMRANICLPSMRRSGVETRLTTNASRQAAHSVAEPRASSKNLARVARCLLPFPSAVLNSEDRLARSK